MKLHYIDKTSKESTTTEKQKAAFAFLHRKDVFADVFSAFFMEEKRGLDPDTLVERPVGILKDPLGGDKDLYPVCYTDGKFIFTVIGLNFQDESLLYRIMNYEAGEYLKQVSNPKCEKILPMLTALMNFSCEVWQKPRILFDMFEKGKDPRLLRYALNYGIHVIDPMSLDL